MHMNFISDRTLSLLMISLYLSLAINLAVANPGSEAIVDPASLPALQRDLNLDSEQLQLRISAEHAATAVAQGLQESLGSAFAGAWLELDEKEDIQLVIAVTDKNAIAEIRAIGALPRLVTHNLKKLETVKTQLDHEAALRRTLDSIAAWYVDVKTNHVVVEFVSGKDEAAEEVVDFVISSGTDPEFIRFIEVESRPEPFFHVRGGDPIRRSPTGPNWCSIGFSAYRFGSAASFTTAGHCITGSHEAWYDHDGNYVGIVDSWSYPYSDHATLLSSNSFIRPWVNNYSGGNVIVVGEQEALVGATVCRSGWRTQFRCGTVRQKGVSANYGSGAVHNLWWIDACAGGGDSGGSAITPAGHAQGMTSGGQVPSGQDTNCGVPQAQRVTYIYPWLLTKQAFSLQLYTQ